MKTSPIIFFFTIGVILFNCNGISAQDNFSNEKIIKVLKSFYTSYITENSKMPTNEEVINSLKKKYCTSNLLNKIKKQDLDYDPFLNAQDSDVEWLKTLTIKKDSKKNDLYHVSYMADRKITINIIVVKQKEDYKIDSVW